MTGIIQKSIDELLKNRDREPSIPKKTEGIQDYTKKQLSMSVSELRELFDLASRIRSYIDFIKSFGEISLIDEIDTYFRSLCADNSKYQEIFSNFKSLEDPFDNYCARCVVLYKALSFLSDNKKLEEIRGAFLFLKNLDKKDFAPLSEKALKEKLSKK